MEELLYEKLDKYYDRFGDAFPTMRYSFSTEEMIEKIDQCLEQGKTIKEIMPLKSPKNAVY
jgi:hypothetical protein